MPIEITPENDPDQEFAARDKYLGYAERMRDAVKAQKEAHEKFLRDNPDEPF